MSDREKNIIETLREGNRELRFALDAANARADAAEARAKKAKDFIGHIMMLGLLRGSPRLRDEALKILDGNDDLEKGGE